MIIREETKQDFPVIYDLVKKAFETAEVSDGDEQDYVNKLRENENYIPSLALVVENTDGEIIAHIMLTSMYVQQPNDSFEALLLSPICVQLEYRNLGIGSELIKTSLQRAKEKGYKAVFLVGNPDYYQRFGFKSISNYNITHTDNIPEQYVMALELEKDVLKNIQGTISIC